MIPLSPEGEGVIHWAKFITRYQFAWIGTESGAEWNVKHAAGLSHDGGRNSQARSGPAPIRYPSAEQVFAEQDQFRENEVCETPVIDPEKLPNFLKSTFNKLKGVS